jgi:Subtilase family
MNRSFAIATVFSVLTLGISSGGESAVLTQAQLEQLAQSASRDVIVIMRDQLPTIPPTRGALGARSAALSASHRSVLAELQRAGAAKIREFGTINAIATTVTRSEVATLAANPQVQAVVDDAVIPRKPRIRESLGSAVRAAATAAAPAAASGLCNTLEPQALQLTNTAFLDSTIPQAQLVRDGNGELVTGKGVKVAVIFADGLDPTISGFSRPDGSPVFIDYQDFSGDAAGTPMSGAEAFLDASSIAAQDNPNGKPLIFDISQYGGTVYPLPSPCNIRIRGMAPGAALIGVQLGDYGYNETTSDWVRGIEYAVADGADVIDETFALDLVPDTNKDPVSLANAAAVAAGVTVVSASGDAGSASTMTGVPPEVIAVGATNSFRGYAQLNLDAFPLSNGGYLNDNISSLSSGGFTQTGARTVDVVAPGDLGWSLCGADTTLFVDCINFLNGGGSPIQVASGTSESAPYTAGEAALVIQAYRSTHHGTNPTPLMVKQIIMSTATDLGAPAYEQGAGLINSLAAVNAALSIPDGGMGVKGHGQGLVYSPTSAEVTDMPGTHETRSFMITNTGTAWQHVEPDLQTLGAPFAGANLTLPLDPATDATFVNEVGSNKPYIEQKFYVPAGAQHLDAAIAWQVPINGATPLVEITLLDPSGRFAAYSSPQGPGSGYGNVDVVQPAAGYWTAIVWSPWYSTSLSYTGPVKFTWNVERYESLGSVSPSSFDLAPGASQAITVRFQMPSRPGDSAGAIRFSQAGNSNGITSSEIPLTMRTLIPIDASGGAFTGMLTGGNGRTDGAPTQTFAFDVPAGVPNMTLALELSDSGYLLEGLLIDPQGMPLSVQGNLDPLGNPQAALQLSRFNPQPGRWRFLLVQNLISSGNQTSEPFTARIGFNTANVTAPGLPNDSNIWLSASAIPVTIPITVTNNGPVTQAYFADARLNRQVETRLVVDGECTAGTLPGACMQFAIPTEVSEIQFFAQSPAPIDMTVLSYGGYGIAGTDSPYLTAKKVSPHMVVASLGVPEVPYGYWVEFPSNIGPYGAGGAPTAPVNVGATVVMQPFDAAVSADSGDIWLDLTSGSNTYNPLILAPGQTGIINVTFTPDPTQVGKSISGFIYVDTYNYFVYTGDEVARIPYIYTISK